MKTQQTLKGIYVGCRSPSAALRWRVVGENKGTGQESVQEGLGNQARLDQSLESGLNQVSDAAKYVASNPNPYAYLQSHFNNQQSTCVLPQQHITVVCNLIGGLRTTYT